MIGSYAGRVIGVLRAVEFNDQSAFLAAKVSDIVTDWELPAEFERRQLATGQASPQLFLSGGLIPSEGPRARPWIRVT